MKGFLKRLFSVPLFFILLAFIWVEIVYFSLRWIYNGKAFPDYPLIAKYFILNN